MVFVPGDGGPVWLVVAGWCVRSRWGGFAVGGVFSLQAETLADEAVTPATATTKSYPQVYSQAWWRIRGDCHRERLRPAGFPQLVEFLWITVCAYLPFAIKPQLDGITKN